MKQPADAKQKKHRYRKRILDFCGVLEVLAPKGLERSPYKICELGEIYLA
ncbi:MAG: hypothetical protein PUJ19_03260 [Campylobacteraceae bacterium]|nr:hypothetical protein [Campylobacteraceae bacterium]MDY4121840.1 hypothetical protein [Campylobacter sp.]